jgi:serine phosphatase RsbU (regulator of sigma subunit)/LysM repeat protein
MATKHRPDLSPATAGYMLLASLNVVLVLAGGVALTRDQAPAAAESHRVALADRAEALAARFATGLVPHAQTMPALPAQAARLAPPEATYELAGDFGGRWRVIASSDAARVGQPPSASLLASEAPEGAFAPAGGPMTTYTAFHHVDVPAAKPAAVAAKPAAAATAKPAPKPTAKPVTRTVVKRVTDPGGTHVVREGDTLYQLSRKYYGTDAQFYAIYQLNRAAIGADRSNLPEGIVLKLPPRTREVRTVVTETPKPAAKKPVAPAPAAATPQPAPTPRPAAAPRRLALALTMAAPAPTPAPVGPSPGVLGAAGLTGAAWLLGGWLLVSKRRRRLDEQRRRFLSGMDTRMRLRGAALDPAALHSPWRVAHAGAVLDASEPGGAFTDVLTLSDSRLGIFVGDATGSAANAVLSRGLAVATWRAKASAALAPAETLLALNRLVADQVPQGDHVTGFYAQIDLLSGAVTHAAASHSGAYIVGADGTLTMVGGKGMPLGLGQELFAARLESGVGRLKDGDTLWIFTDGLIKAENPQGEPFGLERLEACLREGARLGPDRLIALVSEAVKAFVGQRPLADDAAMSALHLSPKPARSAASGDNTTPKDAPLLTSPD